MNISNLTYAERARFADNDELRDVDEQLLINEYEFTDDGERV